MDVEPHPVTISEVSEFIELAASTDGDVALELREGFLAGVTGGECIALFFGALAEVAVTGRLPGPLVPTAQSLVRSYEVWLGTEMPDRGAFGLPAAAPPSSGDGEVMQGAANWARKEAQERNFWRGKGSGWTPEPRSANLTWDEQYGW